MLGSSRYAAFVGLICLAAADVSFSVGSQSNAVDHLVFGDKSSQQAHAFHADHTDTVNGALGEQAIRLLPLSTPSIDGGTVAFTMKVDPQAQNYVTVKLWGGDKGEEAGRLLLWADGKQVGYRHEGDYDVLNQCDEEGQAPGRFVYTTLPLPKSMTEGRTSIDLKISALGRMWSYGSTFAQYQRNLVQPSRGLYVVYTHTDPRLAVSELEKQGQMPQGGSRTEPGEGVIAKSKQIVIERLGEMLKQVVPAAKSHGQKARLGRLQLLSEAYNTSWTPAYHSDAAIEQIVQDGDSLADDAANVPHFVDKDWTGTGALGEAVVRVWPAVSKRLDEKVLLGGTQVSRRDAWADALLKSVDYWRTHRRSYTNQSMIVDYAIFTANRGLQMMAPDKGIPEDHALHFLYQSIGIEPWLGSDQREDTARVADSPDQGTANPYGDQYHLITRKSLSRELGWVATYGETILHFGVDMVKFTDDAKIREQLAKMAKARLIFRYPALDADGNACMKLVSEIDNRTAHFPLSGSAYVAPNIREEWWMDLPALLNDEPAVVGAAQQSIADGQYFSYVGDRLKINDPDTLGMMRNVDEYAKVKALPPSSDRLPLGPGQPDNAFADEQDAVIALKHGETRLFINLYFRAERGVNDVARIFETNPANVRVVTARTITVVNGSGQTYKRPDWIDWTRSVGKVPPGQTIHQAWAGEEMPIAARPAGATIPAYGDWGPFLGKALFYQLRYGNYFVGMNSSEDKTFPLEVPPQFHDAKDLISGKTAAELAGKPVPAMTTVILALPAATS